MYTFLIIDHHESKKSKSHYKNVADDRLKYNDVLPIRSYVRH